MVIVDKNQYFLKSAFLGLSLKRKTLVATKEENVALGVSRKDLIMVVVLLSGVLLAVLNQTLLSPALPSIMNDMGVNATTVQWLTSGYSLVEAIIIPLAAYLIGRFSTRQLFNCAMVVFSLGSIVAAISPSFEFLLLGRVLQAAGTAIAMPMVSTVILLVFPREKRGTAMGVIGLVIGFAPAVGPSVAGFLVDTVGWRALFGIITALGVIVVLLGIALLRNYGDFKRTTFDKLSVVLSSIGLVSLLYGLSTFSSGDNLVLSVVLIIVGLIVIALFVKRQFDLETPMLNVGILRSNRYAISVVAIMIIQAALVGAGVILPLYIQQVRGYTALASGLVILPGAVLGAVMGMIGGRLFDRYGVRRVVIPGVLIILVGSIGFSLFGLNTDILLIALANTILMIGMQFITTPTNTWGINSLPNEVLQHAQSLSNTLNQVAASVGTALLVSVSALASGISPANDMIEKAFFGYHVSFCCILVLMAAVAIIAFTLVRDKKVQTSQARVGAIETGKEGSDYAAMLSGTTVDSTSEAAVAGRQAQYSAMTAADAMNRQPVVALDTANMAEVIEIMAKSDTSGVPIVDAQGDLVGFISDGDVAAYLGKSELSVFDLAMNLYRFTDDSTVATRVNDLLDLNVMAIATKHVISVQADTPFDEACRILAERHIKKVPVVEGKKVVGALSRRNIMHSLARFIELRPAVG